MASTTPKVTTDPRHPDTNVDKVDTVEALSPSQVTPADLDPATYGFVPIDTAGVEAKRAEGPGFLEPVRVESMTHPDNSTFASRARAKNKVVTGESGVTGK